jgi:aminopeptidase N
MLRSIVGDAALKEVLKNYRREVKADDSPQRLEQMLEQKTGTSLGWFFDDWVYADKGLPDLSIVQVTPRQLPARGAKLREQGATGGWLVAVEVKNDGDAVAEVPVTVRSGTLTATERLRIPGKTSASTRILFEKTPEEVVVGDGEVPEMRQGRHTRHITIEPTK